jgi:hypothetical protein
MDLEDELHQATGRGDYFRRTDLSVNIIGGVGDKLMPPFT